MDAVTIQNDKALDVAVGNSRKTKTWKNRPMQWSELLDRMARIMGQPIEWAPGLLLRADGYTTDFYMKD